MLPTSESMYSSLVSSYIIVMSKALIPFAGIFAKDTGTITSWPFAASTVSITTLKSLGSAFLTILTLPFIMLLLMVKLCHQGWFSLSYFGR